MSTEMKHIHIIILLLVIILPPMATTARAESTVTLDSCRSMALSNNKQLQIAREQQRGAEYNRKAARAAYLPSLDFSSSGFASTGVFAGFSSFGPKKISAMRAKRLFFGAAI